MMTRSITSSIALRFSLAALLLASSGSIAQAKGRWLDGSMFNPGRQTSSNDRYQRTRSTILAQQQVQAERRDRVNRAVMGIITAQTAANRQQSLAEQHRRLALSPAHNPNGVLKLAPKRDPNGILTLVPERNPNGILTLVPERDPKGVLKLAPQPDPMGTLILKSPSSDRSQSAEVLRRIQEARSSGATQQPERRPSADNAGEDGVLQLQENDQQQ